MVGLIDLNGLFQPNGPMILHRQGPWHIVSTFFMAFPSFFPSSRSDLQEALHCRSWAGSTALPQHPREALQPHRDPRCSCSCPGRTQVTCLNNSPAGVVVSVGVSTYPCLLHSPCLPCLHIEIQTKLTYSLVHLLISGKRQSCSNSLQIRIPHLWFF